MMSLKSVWNIILILFSCRRCVLGVEGARKIPITESCPLCDFVYHDDGVFDFQMTDQWDLSTNESLNIPVQTYVFNMTSTKYFEGGVGNPVWWHTLIINIPNNLQFTDKAFLMLAGLQNRQFVDQQNKDLIGTAMVAAKTGSVTAAVFHIPNDPINFLASPTGQPLDSDWSLGFGQILYYNTKNPNLLLLPAMTKVAILAMDLIQSPGIEGYTSEVKKFTVAGESKRGWVAWLAGAIDDRVEALIPVTASSFMEIDKNVHLMKRAYGGFSFFYLISRVLGIFTFTDHKDNRFLAKVIDPLSYRDYLDMPKLVVVSASDDVFMPDATKFWFEKMPGDNKLWILENRGHFLELYPNFDKYWEGIGAYYASHLTRYPRPCVSWRMTSSAKRKTGTIKMFTSHLPKSVTAFYANSVVSDRRDFRTLIWCPTCPEMKMCPVCPALTIKLSGIQWIPDTTNIVMNKWKVDGTLYSYRVTYDFPDTGFLGFFMQMVFDGPGGTDMTYTSEMNIIPNTFPHPDCKRSECGDPTVPLV